MKMKIDLTKMKDSMFRYRVGSLFYELRKPELVEEYPPLYTLKEYNITVPSFDNKGLTTYPSLKKIYMSYEHVPFNEYEFAMDTLGSWEHWKFLSNSASLKETIADWREELAIKLKSTAIRKIITASADPSASGVNAAKYLADEGYIPKKVGRVTKEERQRVLRQAAGVTKDLTEDMERIGLTVINGAK